MLQLLMDTQFTSGSYPSANLFWSYYSILCINTLTKLIDRTNIVITTILGGDFLDTKYEYSQLIGYKIIKGEVLIKRKMLSTFMDLGYDITFEQWTVLNVLYVEPGLIQSEIAEKTYKDKTNVTRILDVLCKNGYTVRESHEKDRRSSCIYLTDKGRKMFADLIPRVEAINKQFKTGLTDVEVQQFNKILEKICSNAE